MRLSNQGGLNKDRELNLKIFHRTKAFLGKICFA